jgi:hypothetical protein
MDNAEPAPSPSLASRAAGWMTVGALFLLIGAPFGYRIGLLGPATAVALFAVGAVLALLAVIAGLVGIARALMPSANVSGGFGSTFSVLIGGVALAAVLYWMVIPGLGSPSVHDVSTSVANPPEFDVLRVAHYAGRDYVSYREYDAEMKGKVASAYPGLRTLVFDKSLHQVFSAAEASAKDLHWQAAAADPFKGRIEATDRATIFGFTDDIVIRVRLNPAGYTVLDIRSASRNGMADWGRNARRIQSFIAVLNSHLPQYSTPSQTP